MGASLGWIDFSIEDRNRVGSILDMLKPEGMVDELGLGTNRDGLANAMFPGISTIQTRAKYFFFIPYILSDYQRLSLKAKAGKSALRYLEDEENEVMWKLADKYEHRDGTGVIGITKRRNEKIARRASAIYWNGIATYEFIKTNGLSAQVFLRQSGGLVESLLSNMEKEDDKGKDDLDADYSNTFKIKVPPNPGWQTDLSLDLSKKESEFFKDQILFIAKGKLIAELLENQELWLIFKEASSFADFARKAVNLSLPPTLLKTIVLAHDFSELMYGAHILYNILIQKVLFKNDEFGDDWRIWKSGLKSNMLDFNGFLPEDVFAYNLRGKNETKNFIIAWWSQAELGFGDLRKIETDILKQEAEVKKSKARLMYRKPDGVVENSWVGLKHFDYRFNEVKRILIDIKSGLDK